MRITMIFKFRNKAIFVVLFERLLYTLSDKLVTCKNWQAKYLATTCDKEIIVN